MKLTVIIFWFTLHSFLISQSASIIDSIKQEKVVTSWTSQIDYFVSDYKVDPRGIARDYDGMLFYKYKYGAVFIDKKNGNIFKRMWQSLEGSQDQGGYPYNIHTGNWDLSPTDTSNIIVGEYGAYGGDQCNIISYKEGNADTLVTWINGNEDFYRNQSGSYYFHAINDTEFLAQFDVFQISPPIEVDRKLSYYINKESGIKSLSRMNISNLSINQSKNRILTIMDSKESKYQPAMDQEQHSFDFFDVNDGDCSQYLYIDIGNGSYYSDFIDDSLIIYKRNDSLYLYNLVTKDKLAANYINSNTLITGLYYDKLAYVANIVTYTQSGKHIYSIHVPTRKLVMDKLVDAPYLGKSLTQLEDGYQLSIGDNRFLYKHRNDIFKYDSITVDFTNENTTNNIVEFQEVTFGAITEWDWNFGDGNTSEESNPTHRYDNPGDYEVILSVKNAFGNEKSITKTITVEDKLNASFDFDKFSGSAPFVVDFQNTSTPNAKQYIWNFGDGTYSNEENAVHTYTSIGTYTVSLTVMDENENFHTHLSAKKLIVTE